MDLVYLCYEFPVLTQTFTLAEVRGLDRSGMDLTVVSCRRPPGGPPEGLRVLYLPHPLSARAILAFLGFAFRRPIRTASLFLTIATARYRDQPFRCWARGFLQLLWGAHLAGRFRRNTGKPHFHAQFVDAASTVGLVASRLLDATLSFTNHTAYNPYLLRPKLRHAAAAMSISEFDRELLDRMGGGVGADRIRVVYQGVDPEAWSGRERAAADGPLRILSVGALREKKGHHFLVAALADLRARGVAAVLTIVGEGPERGRIEAEIRRLGLDEVAVLAGAEAPASVRDRLLSSDVFALACVEAANGDLDGVPMSLMEAMAAGLPVVSTRISGVPELIEDGREGWLAAPGDVPGLADHLQSVANDRDEAAARAARAREKVARQHDVEKSVAEMARIFREIAGGA